MDESIYETCYRLEHTHWWNLARREIIFHFLAFYCPDLCHVHVLDIGSGSGSYLEVLEERGILAEAHDSSEKAITYIKQKCKSKVLQKKFPDDYQENGQLKYDVVLLLDVLEHIENDALAVTTAIKLVKKGGLLLITVPSCKKMWSGYDILAHHFRRYCMGEMKDLLEIEGVRIKKISYFSTVLFPLIFLVRVIEGRFFNKNDDQNIFRPHFVPQVLNAILFHIFNFEKYILRFSNLPFGSSIIAILEKE